MRQGDMVQPGVSFIYSSQRLNQVSVQHQDIKSSEQGLKRWKVIRTVKKGIVDKVLNEPKDACIDGGYIFWTWFSRLSRFDISKSFYRNHINYFKNVPNVKLWLVNCVPPQIFFPYMVTSNINGQKQKIIGLKHFIDFRVTCWYYTERLTFPRW